MGTTATALNVDTTTKVAVTNMIRPLREKRGMTIKDLAKRSGKSRDVLTRWELNQQQPRIQGAVKIAHVLECSLDDLFTFEIVEL